MKTIQELRDAVVEAVEDRLRTCEVYQVYGEQNRYCNGCIGGQRAACEAVLALWEAEAVQAHEEVICTCPVACDCEKPPSEDGDEDFAATSLMCPVHNENPAPDPNCLVHAHTLPEESTTFKNIPEDCLPLAWQYRLVVDAEASGEPPSLRDPVTGEVATAAEWRRRILGTGRR